MKITYTFQFIVFAFFSLKAYSQNFPSVEILSEFRTENINQIDNILINYGWELTDSQDYKRAKGMFDFDFMKGYRSKNIYELNRGYYKYTITIIEFKDNKSNTVFLTFEDSDKLNDYLVEIRYLNYNLVFSGRGNNSITPGRNFKIDEIITVKSIKRKYVYSNKAIFVFTNHLGRVIYDDENTVNYEKEGVEYKIVFSEI